MYGKSFLILSASFFLLSSLSLPTVQPSAATVTTSHDACVDLQQHLNSQILLKALTMPEYDFIHAINDLCPSSQSIPTANPNAQTASITAASTNTASPQSSDGYIPSSFNFSGYDKFGVIEIYPTKENGREWYMNTTNPRSDRNFLSDSDIKKLPDGAWRVSAEHLRSPLTGQVRMEVNTSEGEEEWKNVEITGYGKVVRTTGHLPGESSDLENLFQWYARGGRHDTEVPCEGTSLKGRLHLNGRVSWIKEIWHTGGYTDEKSKEKVTPHLVKEQDSDGHYRDGRWFGFKVIMYNIDNDKAVRMEMYLDERVDNNWIKVNSLVDSGQWYSDSRNFYDVDCGRPRNYVVTNSGPVIGFRSDYVIWEFKNLSIREIDPL
jgi:hypothetical protein